VTRALLALALVGACKAEPAGIADALHEPVAQWKLSRAEWDRTVVDPYRSRYTEYVRAFDAAAPALEAQVQQWRARPNAPFGQAAHYAGDPALTRGQARARWALPVQYPAKVVTLGIAPLDAVFVNEGGSWRAIVGIDTIVLDATRARDEPCSHYLDALGSKSCQEVGWEIAEAALRSDPARLAHACSLAATQCASP
jgi:hypothetical protein